jgi:transglutaminase-like putative cysteine protease
MNKKSLVLSGSIAIVTVLFVVAYSLFNILGVTQSRVKRNELTIVTESSEKIYDTLEMSNDSWYIESGSLAEGDTLTVVVNSSITYPGTITNDAGVTILDVDGKNVTIDYKINYKLGTLVVHPIELTIQTDGDSRLYDGSTLSNPNWRIQSGQLFGSDRIETIMTSSITDPGTIVNQIGVTIFNEAGEVVNNIYEIEYDLGSLTVYAIDITFSTESFEKGYDGVPLFGEMPILKSGALLDSNFIDYGTGTFLTNPGSVSNEVGVRILNEVGQDVSSSYNITYEYGNLTIHPIELFIRSYSSTKVYDSEPLTNPDWDLIHGTILDNHTLIVNVENSITAVGSIENTILASVYDETGVNVSHLYNYELDPGILTVLARDIIIETESDSKLYDGNPLMSDEWNIVVGEISDTHHIEYVMTSSITEPGEIENQIEVTILNESGVDVTNEYTIQYIVGTLTVIARDLIISTDTFEKGYDGLPLLGGSGTIESGQLAENHHMEFGVEASLTNPDTIENELDIRIMDDKGNNVTSAYNITHDFGTLKVLPIQLVLKSNDDSKVYDGLPLSNTEWELLSGTILEGHTLVVNVDNELTNAGTLENTIDAYILNESGNDVSEVYNIEHSTGTLTVYKRDITFSTSSFEKGYDGSPLLGGEATQSGELAATDYIEFGPENSITNPGTLLNEIDIRILNEEGNNVTSSYNITYDFGTLEILPVQLIIKSNDASKVYDGLVLSDNEWELLSGTLLENHTLFVDVDNELIYAGTIDNAINAYVINELGNDVSDAYDLEYITGSLTVHPRDVTFSTDTFEKGYDGLVLLGGLATMQSGSLVGSDSVEFGQESSLTLPGSIRNELDIKIVNEDGSDITSSYNITSNFGTLTVNPIQLVIKSNDAVKFYDALPLSDNEWELLYGTLLDNHSMVVDVDSEITYAGTIANTINAHVFNEFGTDVTSIYDVDSITGSLTVYPRPITISTDTFEKGYDGTPLLGGPASLQIGSLAGTDSIEFGAESSLTTPGTIENEMSISIKNDEGNDVTSSYSITYDYGTLRVLPIQIIIKSNDATKVYDGLPLSNNVWELLNGTLLVNHTLIVDVDNQITEPGFIANTINAYIVNEVGNDVSSFYEFENITGTLTVQPRDISFASSSFEKVYDGLPLLGGAATIQTGSLAGSDSVQFGTEKSIITPGTIENDRGIAIIDSEGKDVTSYYNITTNFGTLEVTPITIIIKSNDANKVYDGLPLSNNEWELLFGSVLSNHTLVVDIDNEITDVGSIDNTIFAYITDELGDNVTVGYNIVYNTGTLSVFSSAYSSNEISKESFDVPNEDVFKVYSPTSDSIYFKNRTWGDYTLSGWTTGLPQDTSIVVNPLSFSGTALEESSLMSFLIQVEYVRAQIPNLFPYYSVDNFNDLNDIHVSGDTSVVNNFNIISYEYDALNPIVLQDAQLSIQENIYQTYVYDNYLAIPDSTKQEMLLLAQANGLSAGSPAVIADVKDYISNAATYNLDFAPIPDDVDVAVYFLTVSKEGICQHYATAATLMYRALGVPARYTTGYLGVVQADQWTTVTGKFAHAWVEVYIDGFGWVPVEVTGSGSGGDTPTPDPIEITVKPTTVSELYIPGKVIAATEVSILGYPSFEDMEYTYEATYGGSLSEVGFASSSVTSFSIHDKDGTDITSLFAITYEEGVLQLFEHNIQLVTSNDSKIYDGSPVTNTNWVLNGSLQEGHVVNSVLFTGEQTNVGTSQNTATIIIHDQFGNDVTSNYNISSLYGELTVYPSEITIQSSSSTKSFDGTALVNQEYEIILGALASTDSIVVTITGSQTGIGKSTNTIESIHIFNNGVEVTFNYTINVIEGELTVTPPY